jgi:hypothetical protein
MLSVAARVDDEPLGPVEVERQVGGRSSGEKRDDEEQRDERERAAARRPDLQIILHLEHPREQIECPHATDRRSHPVVAVRHVCVLALICYSCARALRLCTSILAAG